MTPGVFSVRVRTGLQNGQVIYPEHYLSVTVISLPSGRLKNLAGRHHLLQLTKH